MSLSKIAIQRITALTATSLSKKKNALSRSLNGSSIIPAHTPLDGDTLFAVATGELDSPGDVLEIGSLAAEVTSQAIIRAVTYAKGIPSYPAFRDLVRK